MSESQDTIGYGCTFAIGNGANPEVFTVLAELADVTPMEPTCDDEEVTHHTSPDAYTEWVPGLLTAGEIQTTLNYKKSDVATILALFRVKRNYQITLPDGSTWVARCYLKKFGQKIPLKTKMLHDITWKVCSGKPLWSPAA